MSIDIKKIIEEKNISTIEVIYADTLGTLGGKMVPTKSFLKNYENGFGVCKASLGWDIQGQILDGFDISDFKSGCPDVFIKPILTTLKEIPWRKGNAFVLGEIHEENGDEFQFAPRYILKKLVNKFNELNYRPIVGVELEFYLINADKKPLEGGLHCYSHRRAVELEDILGEIRNNLESVGIDVEATHVEYGPGQIEVILEHGDALEIADKIIIAKSIIKEVSKKRGFIATFMPKPWEKESGSGIHIHQSLWDLNLQKNIFQENSILAKQYLAGLTSTLSEFMFFSAPSINAYKRFSVNSFAPTSESWGVDNRTVAVRSLLSDSKSSRIEQRLGSSDANPYLAIAASLAGGIYGISNKINLEEGSSENAYTQNNKLLPRNLEEAIAKLEKGEIAKEYFGEEFIKLFTKLGKHEIKLYEEAITDWEINRYLELS